MANAVTSPDWWPSPAKLNLFLHILGKQENGYHSLQSLFQMLDHGDKLAFNVTNDNAVTMYEPLPGVPDSENLIIRAANLLKPHAERKSAGALITLEKVLPMGGGIGGGSSNAATTLVALNHLWNCGLSDGELAELGLSLGADVPIFVYGKTAFAQGVGEDITPCAQPEYWYLVVNPGIHISTAEVFSAPDLPRDTPAMLWDDYHYERTRNDCQEIVCNRYPEVAKLLQWLVHYAPSRMTGTGACVFATFTDQNLARQIQAMLPAPWQSFVAKGVNQSPLKQKLQEVNATSDTK
ncbi:4-(cytidine 5'-diphospho)-2-C-methyl-D-erythritol kinase [Alteromonas antoniana]|uniref:4-(cytidine 5'-diphospho)-2-C-methyl-D-erythritol kinase n=1 Tax=Alteromonas antoniana TaxID=2803813 RepID=UPI001C48C78F|nr:4-(cytidine 5'-diphospho)-2-C-methyl-D-erythritol kinase [Alteromonas antoniana]